MLRPLVLALGLAALPPASSAANATFTTAGTFAAAVSSTQVEGFETTAAHTRQVLPIVTPLLTVSSSATPLGVQSGADTPDIGFGSSATQGTHYLSAYLPGLPVGSLRFALAAPALAFGFDLIDIEVPGSVISLRTDTGAFAGGVSLETVATNFANGSRRFFGISQDQAFSQVFITIDGADDAVGIDNIQIAAVPVPMSAALLFTGLLVLVARRRHRDTQRL